MFSERAAPTAQALLGPPSSATRASPTFARVPALVYADRSQPFVLGQRGFGRQYAHIYAARLLQMRPGLEQRARGKWGESFLGINPPFGVSTPVLGGQSRWKLLGAFSTCVSTTSGISSHRRGRVTRRSGFLG